ncbi:MAG: hypothetical protein ACP5HG_17190 [Anaerolineae bacterium]
MTTHDSADRALPRAAALAVLSVALLLAVGITLVRAQTSAGFHLTWHAVANAGGASSSASYRVNGTIGQAIAGPPVSTSASFIVTGGYWAATTQNMICLPAVLKG